MSARKIWNLPPPTDTTNLQLHTEQFALKRPEKQVNSSSTARIQGPHRDGSYRQRLGVTTNSTPALVTHVEKDLRNMELLPKEQGVYVTLKGLTWTLTCPGTQHKSSGLKSAYTAHECEGDSSTQVKASPGAGAQ